VKREYQVTRTVVGWVVRNAQGRILGGPYPRQARATREAKVLALSAGDAIVVVLDARGDVVRRYVFGSR
jgi:hypothetical protein